MYRFQVFLICALGSCTNVVSSAEVSERALFRAIQNGDVRLVESLLRQGTPANLQRVDGTTALMIAARDGSAAMVHLLLKAGADPNRVNNRGVTALLWGAVDADKVQLLLARGADVHAKSKLGVTPVFVAAASYGNVAAVRDLLAQGADPFDLRRPNVHALTAAVRVGDLETVRLLLQHADEHEIDVDNPRLLELASGIGHVAVADLLIDRLVDAGQRPSKPTLNRALLTQKPELAIQLVDAGADLTHVLAAGQTPTILLAAYTETGDTSVAAKLIAKGCDISSTNQEKETAVTWAQRRGFPTLVEVFREAGVPEASDDLPTIPNRKVKLDAQNMDELLVAAIEPSLRLLQHSSDRFLDQRKSCISCHHQNLPAVALAWAETRGFTIDQTSAQRMIDRQIQDWNDFIERADQMDRPVPVPPRFLGYGLWGLSALGYADDDATRASVAYLAAIQSPEGYWSPGMLRPPLGGAEIVSTVLAMRALQLYPMRGRLEENDRRVRRAASWLARQEPRYHQEHVYQLLGLAWAGKSSKELSVPLRALLAQQRPDGGWSQLPHLGSDAWATGQSLVALHVAGRIPPSHPAYRRGLEYLLSTQFEDGSWFVKARAWPFQTHFDAGFPFDKDQWISAPATAWAVMAIALAVEPPEMVLAVERTATQHSQQDRPLPSPFEGSIEFTADIEPILKRSCAGCHRGPEATAGYRVTDRASFLMGGESEKIPVIVGRSDESRLVKMVAADSGNLVMPPAERRDEFPPLTPEEISKLRAWIDRGAAWPTH